MKIELPELEEVTGGAPVVLFDMMESLKGLGGAPLQIAKAAAGASATKAGKRYLTNLIEPKLVEVYDGHVSAEGEYGDNDAHERDEWDEALDDKLETLFEEHEKLVTAGWLGQHCTDNRLYEDDAIAKLARSFGEEAWRVLTFVPEKDDVEAHYMSHTELLQALNIADTDIQAVASSVVPLTPQQQEEKAVASITDTKKKLAVAMTQRGYFDKAELCSDLDDASDDDDGLANGAVARLGGDAADVAALRAHKEKAGIFTADMWGDFADEVEKLSGAYNVAPGETAETAPEATDEDEFDMSAFEGEPEAWPDGHPAAVPHGAGAGAHSGNGGPAGTVAPPSGPPAVLPPPGGAAAATEKPKRSRGTKAPVEGAMSAEALQLLKDHSGMKDDELGAMIGVSRATFANYCKGKAFFVPQPQHVENMSTLINTKREALSRALTLIENGE